MTALLAIIGIGIVVAIGIWRATVEEKSGPKPPRQPLDISPFTAGLLGMDTGRGGAYKPVGITAVTPAGTSVRVACPHLTGHRSPELAVKCGEAEKARIERYGR